MMILKLSTGQLLERERLAMQNQIVLNDESHSQDSMGEEERKSDEAAAAYRFQKFSCTKILKGEKLEKVFKSPEECVILKGVSLTVQRGETIAIRGPSGVGKSTLLHILGTLDTPSKGTLEIMGQDALKMKRASLRNQHIGFVFQNYNLLDDYSVIDNVLMPTKIARISGKETVAKRLLHEVGLEGHTHHLAKQLSGGEKQRVAIARALCNDPDLILADEPTGNLDEENSARIHDLLIASAKKLNKGLIVVTHNHELAKRCDLIYTLRGGLLEES